MVNLGLGVGPTTTSSIKYLRGDAARATVLMASICPELAVLIVPEEGIGVQLTSLPYYRLWHVRDVFGFNVAVSTGPSLATLSLI
jgi:hypothetical protein